MKIGVLNLMVKIVVFTLIIDIYVMSIYDYRGLQQV